MSALTDVVDSGYQIRGVEVFLQLLDDEGVDFSGCEIDSAGDEVDLAG